MSAPVLHVLHLCNGSARMLNTMLGGFGWCTDTGDAYRAGQILEEPALDAVREGDTYGEKEPPKEWRDVPVDIEVSEKRRDTIKKCINHFIGKGALPPGRYTSQLLRECGLAPEE